MSINTITTALGFLKSFIGKYLSINFKAATLDDIFNYHVIDGQISTSGQPTEEQFKLIKQSGFDYVINLAPHNAENSLHDEAGILAKLGIKYTHIPVNFKKPTDINFLQFKDAMQNHADEPVWVHCAANMRVSAFMYRYRRDVRAEPDEIIRKDLLEIWEPFGVWKKFIAP